MPTIQAAVCHRFGAPLTIEPVDLRAPVGREVEITLEAVAICHSDITYAEGHWGGSLPAVYGHEAAGRISALGSLASGYTIGQPVIATLIRACGTCAPCATGAPVACSDGYDGDHGPLKTLAGGKLHQAMACGAFAQKIVVDISQIAAIPEDMPMDAACLLSCGVITGVGAVVNTARLRPGQDVVVIGAGGVGLNAIQGARIAGARRIVAVDMSAEKLAMAAEFGATDGLLATDPAPWDALRTLTGRGADAVIVTVGVKSAYASAAHYLARGGRIVMVGMPPSGHNVEIDPGTMAAWGQGAIGSKMGDVVLARDIPWMVDLYRQGRLKLDELISGRWPLSRINEAIADTKSGAARRNVIVLKA